MLTGEHRHSIDAKNRLFIPAKHRESLGSAFVIAKDIRGPRLKVFSLEAWEAYIAPIKSMDRSLAEQFARFLYPNADPQSPDSQGRATICKDLLDYAHISYTDAREVVILGCGDYAEIWSAKDYEAAKAAENVDALREQLERLGL